MKVAYEVVKARRDRLAQLLGERQYLPLADVCRELGVSAATARRDLAELERSAAITRTWGGARAEFNQRFASFRERQHRGVEAKRRIAQAALALIKPGAVVYLDGGTTLYALAEAIAADGPRPLTVVTNNILVAELLSEVDGVELELLGGHYLRRQWLILGPRTVAAARGWRYDLAMLGTEAIDAKGLWNSSDEVVAVERAVAKAAVSVCLLADAGKLGARAPEFLLPWERCDRLVSDATRAQLAAAGIVLPARHLISA